MEKNAKIVPLFYKEWKRMQRSFHSFIKNGKEHKDRSVLFIKNGKEPKDCSVLLKRTDAQPCQKHICLKFMICTPLGVIKSFPPQIYSEIV